MSMTALKLDPWVESDIKKYADWVYRAAQIDTGYIKMLRDAANKVVANESYPPKVKQRAQWILKYFPDALGY
jgi:hypothetical protein